MRTTIILLLTFQFINSNHAQNEDIGYGIDPVHRVIQNQKLQEVKVITDIDPKFESTWVKEYLSVDLIVDCNQETLSATGTSFAFNDEQLRILKMGHTGGDISVNVSYYPDNMLPKEVKEMNFTYSVGPDQSAEFPGGEVALRKYLKKFSVEQLNHVTDQKIHQARVGFTINLNGEAVNVNMLERSRQPEVDAALIKTISEMPKWIPAKNADNSTVSQDFEYIITRDRCVYKDLHDN